MIILKDENNKLTDLNGKPIADKAIAEYVKNLVIPPAYKNVRIYYENNPKILYDGIDAKGRLQQIYSKKWRTAADKQKFKKLIKFGKELPKIFGNINKHILDKNNTQNKCIAIILKIVSVCYFRIGNHKYEKLYESHGISTIKKHHIYERPNAVEIKFIGKKGVLNECMIEDKELVSVIKEYIKSKKQNDYIFTYTLEGKQERIRATEINDYLKKYDPEFTSKMFRTFDTNTLLIDFLKNRDRANLLTKNERKKNIVAAMKEISQCVNNTPAICKKSYANADLIEMYIENPVRFDKFMSSKNSRELFIDFLESFFQKKSVV